MNDTPNFSRPWSFIDYLIISTLRLFTYAVYQFNLWSIIIYIKIYRSTWTCLDSYSILMHQMHAYKFNKFPHEIQFSFRGRCCCCDLCCRTTLKNPFTHIFIYNQEMATLRGINSCENKLMQNNLLRNYCEFCPFSQN